jgi:hypothetical protein
MKSIFLHDKVIYKMKREFGYGSVIAVSLGHKIPDSDHRLDIVASRRSSRQVLASTSQLPRSSIAKYLINWYV